MAVQQGHFPQLHCPAQKGRQCSWAHIHIWSARRGICLGKSQKNSRDLLYYLPETSVRVESRAHRGNKFLAHRARKWDQGAMPGSALWPISRSGLPGAAFTSASHRKIVATCFITYRKPVSAGRRARTARQGTLSAHCIITAAALIVLVRRLFSLSVICLALLYFFLLRITMITPAIIRRAMTAVTISGTMGLESPVAGAMLLETLKVNVLVS